VLSLKDKYSKPFKDFAVKAGVLTLGGSRALQQAVQEVRQVQQQLPDDSALRVFGRAADEVDAKIALDPMQDVEYLARRCDSADATNELNAAITKHVYRPGRDTFVVVHGVISDALFGVWPGAFLSQHDISTQKYRGPDVMTKEQLYARFSLQRALVKRLTKSNGRYLTPEGKEAFLGEVHGWVAKAKDVYMAFHGDYQDPTDLPLVRNAANRPSLLLPAPADVAVPYW
jgi:hypothetical protein